MKYAWIDSMDTVDEDLWWFSVQLACEVLEVSRSGFYDWRTRQTAPPTTRQLADARFTAEVIDIHRDSRGNYGSPRVHAELADRGWSVSVNRVADKMRAEGLVGRSGRRSGPRTTWPAKIAPDIPDRVKRDFTADAPDQVWCTDLTYVPTAEGWLYPQNHDRCRSRHGPSGVGRCRPRQGNVADVLRSAR